MDYGAYDQLWRRPPSLSATGKGTVLAVIDQALDTSHSGYASRLIDYQAVGNAERCQGSKHASAVVSIAADKNIGVAPEAAIVYRAIETRNGRESLLKNLGDAFSSLQDYIDCGGQIDAISTSHGWRPNEPHTAALEERIAWFAGRNVPVFHVGTPSTLGFAFCGPQGMPQFIQAESPEIRATRPQNGIHIPIDNRLLAAWNDASYYRDPDAGGVSWAVPHVAGLFLLARERFPNITRDEFARMAQASTKTVSFNEGERLPVMDLHKFDRTLSLTGMR